MNRFILFVFILFSVTSFAKPKYFGTETNLTGIKKIHSWCDSLFYIADGFYQWRCCSHDSDVNAEDYNEEHKVCRLGVHGYNSEGVTRSCAHRCGAGGETPAIVRSAYAFTDESKENLSYVIYCECPNILAGEDNPPPKIKKLPR